MKVGSAVRTDPLDNMKNLEPVKPFSIMTATINAAPTQDKPNA